MLDKFKSFFHQELGLKPEEDDQAKLQQACAVLLIEVSRADYDESQIERDSIKQALKKAFTLDDDKLEGLISLSEGEETDATSLYPFTNLINQHYDYPQRVNLVNMLWQVAYADGDLSKYEDYIIRKIADLLFVSHSDFIQTKLNQARAC